MVHIKIFSTFKSSKEYTKLHCEFVMYLLCKVLQCVITESKNTLDIYAYCICENAFSLLCNFVSIYHRGYNCKTARNIFREVFKRWKLAIYLLIDIYIMQEYYNIISHLYILNLYKWICYFSTYLWAQINFQQTWHWLETSLLKSIKRLVNQCL